MGETTASLKLLYRRINEKQSSLGVFDLCIIDSAIEEIHRLRSHEAVLEAELQFGIKEKQAKGSGNE